jgi:hypothetical protein
MQVDTDGRILNPTSYGAQSRIATATIETKRGEAEEFLVAREEAEIRVWLSTLNSILLVCTLSAVSYAETRPTHETSTYRAR